MLEWMLGVANCACMQVNQTLTGLDLSRSELGDDGATAIADALKVARLECMLSE